MSGASEEYRARYGSGRMVSIWRPVGSAMLVIRAAAGAISSHRPHRPALAVEAAVEEVSSETGALFDKEDVESCVRVVRSGSFEL